MGWDEYINLANVCKDLSNVVSGRGAANAERRQVFGRLVLQPLTDAFNRKIPQTDRFFWHPSEEQRQADEEEKQFFDAWKKLRVEVRFETLDQFYDIWSHDSASDLQCAYAMVQENLRAWDTLPIADVMNTVVESCNMVIGEGGRVTIGSVIHRLMWTLNDYPYWVKSLLNNPDCASVVQPMLRELNLGKFIEPYTKPSPTFLLFPRHIMGLATMRNKRHNFDKAKRLIKKDEDLHSKQQEVIWRMRQLYERQRWRAEIAMEAEIMVPKIRAHLQGGTVLQSADLEEIIKALKRASGRDSSQNTSKRRRVIDWSDDE